MKPELEALARALDDLGRIPARRPAPDSAPEFSGTDFSLVRPLGKGAMGSVYEAEQISLARRVAIKVLPAAVSASADRRERFMREAKTLAMLHHPNIVKVYAVGMAGGRLFYAMDLVQGTDLNHSRPDSTDDVAIIGIAAARALAYAHRCGVVHQDVKPANILVDPDGNIHLADFGIAALLEGAESVASSGGTRRYMAPEMRNGRGVASPASDQYALGVTLRELADARKGGKASPEFDAILAKMTAEKTADRYADMDAVADDLQRFLHREPVRARRASFRRRIALWMRRNPSAAFGTAAALLCLVAFVASLAIGYVRTNRALHAAEKARAETERALWLTEAEAANAAQSLLTVITGITKADGNRREAEIARALAAVEQLAERFPANADISNAVGRLKFAQEIHSRIKERRGNHQVPRIPPRRGAGGYPPYRRSLPAKRP